MKILHVAAEAAPYAKSGGLADVLAALPPAQAALGHDVRLILPRYGWIDDRALERLAPVIVAPLGSGERYGALLRDRAAPHPVYLLEHNQYFDRPWPYGPPGGEFADNCERFCFLAHGALAACEALDWQPDVIHVHDWHTALLPVLLNTHYRQRPLGRAASVLTVHNVGYQGAFPPAAFEHTGLDWSHFTHLELECRGELNLLKGGLTHASAITTVSPTHAEEIQTAAGGFGLDDVLCHRADRLYGVLNGIDTELWNPAEDPSLAAHYSTDDLKGKAACKADLQQKTGLPRRPELPLIGLVSRLTAQKGLDVVADALPRLLGLDVQICLLGSGDPGLEQRFADQAARHPTQLSVTLGYNETLAHGIEAGADLFLMPSRWEPCGLNQLYSQRYGCLPIVRATGGLADTVENYDPDRGTGTGFVLWDLSADSLADTVAWAVDTYRHRPSHIRSMQALAMTKEFGWDRAAETYDGLYRQALLDRRG